MLETFYERKLEGCSFYDGLRGLLVVKFPWGNFWGARLPREVTFFGLAIA